MPNYIYKCTFCDYKEVHELPISFDPSIKLHCPDCNKEDKMTRRIGIATFPANCNMVRAGDWYKKQYGHELGEGALNKAQQQEDRKTLEREFRKETGQ